MERNSILECLCEYDLRNPNYLGNESPHKDKCFCDNCFSGRTILANYLLLALDDIERLQE